MNYCYLSLSADMSISITHRSPVLLALVASAALTALVIVGSRNLEYYDPALFGYTVASVVAFGAVVFRYAVRLQRPATRIYWRRGWQLFRDRRRLAANTKSAARTLAHNLVEQRFIAKRGFTRWLMHALIMRGCIISALVTFPLVFGWIHLCSARGMAVSVRRDDSKPSIQGRLNLRGGPRHRRGARLKSRGPDMFRPRPGDVSGSVFCKTDISLHLTSLYFAYQLLYLFVLLASRVIKRRIPVFVLGLHIRAFLQQRPDYVRMPPIRRQH
jgi:hypothetical protein